MSPSFLSLGQHASGDQRADKDAQQRAGHNLNRRMADKLLQAFLVKHKTIARQTIQQVIEYGSVFARRSAHAGRIIHNHK